MSDGWGVELVVAALDAVSDEVAEHHFLVEVRQGEVSEVVHSAI